MAHAEQFAFLELCREQFPEHFRGASALEIGSLDINTSARRMSPRSLFAGGRYTGIDIAPGPGVDFVCPGDRFQAPADSYDVVLSCEVMEHNRHWRETFANMTRMCRPGGLVIMTCATPWRPEHGTAGADPTSSPMTTDYYRNLPARDFRRAGLTHPFACSAFWNDWSSYDLYFLGVKDVATADCRPKFAAITKHYRRKTLRSTKTVRRWLKAAVVGAASITMVGCSPADPAVAKPAAAAEQRAKAGPYVASTTQLSDTETLTTVVIPSAIDPVLDRHCYVYRNREFKEARFVCPTDAPIDTDSR